MKFYTFIWIAVCNLSIILPGIFVFFAQFVDAKGLIDGFYYAAFFHAVLVPLHRLEFVAVARGNVDLRVVDGQGNRLRSASRAIHRVRF